jgi:hypothetical protein
VKDIPDKIVGCKAVNDHLGQTAPTPLWHYTSYAGFQGIIESKRIWASEYRFLNDREELLHAKELAETLAEEEPEFIGEQFPARDTVKRAVKMVFNAGHLQDERHRVMVASFSASGDQLSQWRGYADDSRGVSIAFDLGHLRPPKEIGTTVTFAPCLYRQADKAALLKSAFAHYRDGIQNWWESLIATARLKAHATTLKIGLAQKLVQEHEPALRATLRHYHATLEFDLLRVAPLLKHESFHEENEWRLVLPLNPESGLPKSHAIEFRPARNTLIPYIAYPIAKPDEETLSTCVGLILGPGSHPAAEVAANLLLQKEKIRVLAKRSRVPYRPT